MARMMRQFRLREGSSETTCWLEDDKRLRVGTRVTLKDSADPKRLWTIEHRGSELREASKIDTRWNVGGLEEGRRR